MSLRFGGGKEVFLNLLELIAQPGHLRLLRLSALLMKEYGQPLLGPVKERLDLGRNG